MQDENGSTSGLYRPWSPRRWERSEVREALDAVRGIGAEWRRPGLGECICAGVDWLRRWRSRGPAGRATMRRAVTALAVLLVTAAAAVLLAVVTHTAWPPVVVAILGTLPALYVAWLAVPGGRREGARAAPAERPAFGLPVNEWTPVELGVHQVIGGGPMSAYVLRPHDDLLRAALNPAVPASRSRRALAWAVHKDTGIPWR